MDEAIQYLGDVGADLSALYQEEPPVRRLWAIYRTSRRNMRMARAAELWECLLPLRETIQRDVIPESQLAYDAMVVDCALSVESVLASLGASGGFGIGQKIVNLYMKDQWALGRVSDLEPLLHAPIDGIVYDRVRRLGMPVPSWSAWTKVIAGSEDAQVVADYLALQRFIRDFAAASPQKTAIRAEQWMWHSGLERAQARIAGCA